LRLKELRTQEGGGVDQKPVGVPLMVHWGIVTDRRQLRLGISGFFSNRGACAILTAPVGAAAPSLRGFVLQELAACDTPGGAAGAWGTGDFGAGGN
jgi:hypothetical protein